MDLYPVCICLEGFAVVVRHDLAKAKNSLIFTHAVFPPSQSIKKFF